MAEDGIYVTGVVIPNGIPDHEGDILSKKDIKIIFTKFLEQESDVQHNYIKNKGVEQIANWISETDRTIAGKTAPAGSWLATFYVTNKDIIKSIQSNDPKSINGLSLGSVPKKINEPEYWFINKSINYHDLQNIEDVIPKFISFVAKPSNMFGLEIEDYNVYINKSINETEIMTGNENNLVEEEKLTLSGWERIVKGLHSLGINKNASNNANNNTVTDNKPIEPKVNDDISNKELADKIDKIPEAVTNGIVNAFEKLGKNEGNNPEPNANESSNNNADDGDEAKNNNNAGNEPKNNNKGDEPAKKTKKEGINKSATNKVENINTVNPNASINFYKKSGRDMWGCRIKK